MPILTPEERLGQCLAERYRLDSLLCAGGMGVLFRARDLREQRDVAIKMVKPAHAIEPDRVARFLHESAVARRVVHPNVTLSFDAWTDENGVPFLIMELLEGRSLDGELERVGLLSLARALEIVLPIVRALEAAHALGVIHRDVKPNNIFLCDGPGETVIPKLLDFGIAKSAELPFETQTGMLLGTPGYIAPEQAQFGDCSELTDVWAVGAVLYRCLTGHAPHASAGAADLLSRLVREPVPPLTAAGVSKRAAALIDRALARDPHRRYSSMAAFGRVLSELQLESAAAHTGEIAAPPQRRPVKRLPTMLWVAASVLGLLTLGSESAGSTDGRAIARRLPVVVAAAETEPMRPAPLAPSPPLELAPRVNPQPRRRLARRPPPTAAKSTPLVEHETTTGLPLATEW